jgi:hypothetical protein
MVTYPSPAMDASDLVLLLSKMIVSVAPSYRVWSANVVEWMLVVLEVPGDTYRFAVTTSLSGAKDR